MMGGRVNNGSGLRLWFPDGGPDLMLAVEQVEIAVYVDSMTEPHGGVALTDEQIDAHPRMMAERVPDHLEKRRAKAERKATLKPHRKGRSVPRRGQGGLQDT